MGSVHQLAKLFQIIIFQSFHRADRSLVLINGMFRALFPYLILDRTLVRLKLFLGQIAQTLDVHYCLKLLQRFLALAPALVVRRIDQRVLHIAVSDDNLRPVQHKRRILIGEIRRIQKDRIVLLTHCRCKLIHDTAVHAVEIIFRILADQRQIYIGHVKPKQVAQIKTRQHLQRSGR